MTNNYAVGYKNPPKHTQFKKGCSGNSKGRPKGKKDKSLNALLEKELESKLVLPDGSKITKKAAIVKQTVHQAISGNDKSAKLAIDLMKKCEKEKISESFLKRLINENYITQDAANDYAHHKNDLDFNGKSKTINNILYKKISNETSAWDSVHWLDSMSFIGNTIICKNFLGSILFQMQEEISFWEGIELSLRKFKIQGEERLKAIASFEKKRRFKRPTKQQYNNCFKLNFILLLKMGSHFNIIIKSTLKKPFFEEQKEAYFNEDRKKSLLEHAKKELDEISYKHVQDILNECKADYETFINQPLYNMNLDEVHLLTKCNITPKQIEDIFTWYKNERK